METRGTPGGPLLAHGAARVSGVPGRTWAHGHMAHHLLARASMAACGHALTTWHGRVCMARVAPCGHGLTRVRQLLVCRRRAITEQAE